MSAPVSFNPLAQAELLETSAYYEARARGLGGRFLDSVERELRLLENHPEAGPRLHGETRRLVLRGFPYSLLYEVRESEVRILAVSHQKRRPLYWVGRR
jgi:toxin ParE1/3/4